MLPDIKQSCLTIQNNGSRRSREYDECSSSNSIFDKGKTLDESNLVDTMIKDGLWDAFNGYHMGITAENVAAKWQITRKDQDNFALSSQFKAEKAQKDGKFKNEISSEQF